MPNYRDLYIKQTGTLALVIEKLDVLSAFAKAEQQRFETIIIETEPLAPVVVVLGEEGESAKGDA